MLFPISDDNSDRIKTPYINYFLIIANVLVFIVLQGMGHNGFFDASYWTVPAEILTGKDIIMPASTMVDQATGHEQHLPELLLTPIPVYLTLITSMFMHGGWLHLIGQHALSLDIW